MSEQYPPSQTAGSSAYGATAPVYTDSTAPPYSDRPVALRGPESLGGLLLILAGVAAAISLMLDWLADILVPLADAGWDLGFFAIGFWFGIAVAVLGLLGSLKALVTRPKVAP